MMVKQISSNSSAGNQDAVSEKIGKFGGKETVARIGQDMMAEAKATAASLNFDLIRILTENFNYCKDKGRWKN